ncbi:HalOD1 output domain-containing protein [Salinigranum sp. GCM10025319]|uniref:HalOD1 output domain-containing protein n=1 Tax=Salinigranum sp. GCM10025319 TaxID=3252687 RepID=UPI00362337B4
MSSEGEADPTAFVGRVLTELVAQLDVDPLDLEPLYHSIDLEAVEEFYRREDPSMVDVIVEFDYYHHRVRIDATGAVSVTTSDDEF